MAKTSSFSVARPPSDDLLERMARFLVEHTAKQADINVSGTVRKRRPGETGPLVKDCRKPGVEAS